MMPGQSEPSNSADDDQPTIRNRSYGGWRGARRALPLALVAGLCVIIAGAALAVIFLPGGGKAGQVTGAVAQSSAAAPAPPASSPQSASSTAPSPAGTAPESGTAPKVASNKAAKPILTWPSRLNHKVQSWESGAGGKALLKVETDMGTAMQSAGAKLYVPMRMACSSLDSDVSAAQAGPPIPDGAIQHVYLKALAGLSGAAARCQAAISIHASGDETSETHVNQALLARARLEFAAMSEKLYHATAGIRSLRG